MSGTAIQMKFDDAALQKELKGIVKRAEDLTPAMKLIGNIVRTSVVRNFEKEGRPVRWKKHSKQTEKQRGKGATILRKEGHLMNSIHPEASKNGVVVSTGTGIKYAAVHQFGAKKGSFGRFLVKINKHNRTVKSGRIVEVKAHTREMALPWGDIPARPFMMIQDEDWDEIKATLKQYVFRGGA